MQPSSPRPLTIAEMSARLLVQPMVATPNTPMLTVMAHLGESSAAGHGASRPPEGWVVVEEQRVVGLLTLGDVGRLMAQSAPLEAVTVGQVMSHPVIILPQAKITEPWTILDLFHQHAIRHLPVVDDQGSLVGLLTQPRLIQTLAALGVYRAKAEPQEPASVVTLPRRERLLSQLATTVPGLLYGLDIHGLHGPGDGDGIHPLPPALPQVAYISPQSIDILGISAEALMGDGERFFDLIHPADRPDYWAALEASATTQQPFFQEYRIVTPTGQEKWLRAHSQPQPLPQGGVRWLGIALEITGRKQAEHDLILASRRLQEAQRIAQIGNWEMDLWTNTLHWSEEIFRIFEIDPQRFGASYEAFLQAIHPEDRAAVHEAYSRHLWDKQPYKIAHRLLFPDGRIKYVQEQCETLYDASGNPYLSQGTVQDVTELKQVEMALAELNADLEQRVAQRAQALRQSEARYRQIVETANEGVWILDAEAHHSFGNPTLLALLGQTDDDMAETCFWDYFDRELHPQIQAMLQRCGAGQAEQAELPLRRRDGSVLWVLASVSPIFTEGGQYQGLLAMVTDITERRQAEEAIRQENTFRQLILDNLTEGICVCHASPGFPFVYFSVWNPQMEMITGYGQEEINRLGWYQSLYPDPQVRQQAIDRMASMRQGENLMAEEWEIRHRNGTYRTVTITTTLLVDAEGDGNVLGVVQNITARKQAERQIQQQIQQEALLREITQHIRQSLDLQVIFNTACQEIRQVLEADRVGIFRFDPQPDCHGGAFVAEALTEGVISVLAIPVHDHCFIETYVPQYIQGRYAAMDDIMALKKCHTSILVDFQVKANLVLPLICGEDLWGLLCIHQCHHSRHWEQEVIDLGQQLAAQLAIAIQQATLYDHLQRELSTRQQAQAQLTQTNQFLAQSNQELARATRLKDEFLANMSHELRTPLNAIMGMTEGMQEEVFGPITPEQRKSLQTVESSAVHLLSLINDILDVAKIEAGQIELDLSSVAVAPLCASALAFVKQQAVKKQIRLETHIPSPLPNLWADERRVRQALLNLLANAVKFTPAQGRVFLAVTLVEAPTDFPHALEPPKTDDFQGATAISPGAFLRFAVTDTGIGISPENIRRLFRPFVQIDSALNRQYNGTGLGLTLVKQIAELHGGRVDLQSELGVGSCFTIDLPCDPASLSSLAPDQVKAATLGGTPPAADPLHTPLVLLAEDNEANIRTIASYLKAKGYRLNLAQDGQQALDQAQATPPDIILMDIQMPGMDGLTTLKHIRQMPALDQVPIIALTALATASDEERCLTAGANAYLSKPVRLNQLATLIHSLLHPQ